MANSVSPAKNFSAPIRLVQIDPAREVVRFEKGLEGAAIFGEDFEYLHGAFEKMGILLREYELESYPSAKQTQCIHLQDPEFGKAFYEIYFPKFSKSNPKNYEWELLQ